MKIKDSVIFLELFVQFFKIIDSVDSSTKLDCEIIKDILTVNESYPRSRVKLNSSNKFSKYIPRVFIEALDLSSDEIDLIKFLFFHKIKCPESLPMVDDEIIRHTIFNTPEPQGEWLFDDILQLFILKKSRNLFENELMVRYFDELFGRYRMVEIVD